MNMNLANALKSEKKKYILLENDLSITIKEMPDERT